MSAPGRVRQASGGELLSLETVERRRRQLWAIAGFFLLAVSALIVIVFTDTGLRELVPDIPALRWAFLVLTVAFLLYVVDQERTLRKVTRTLIHQDSLTASLESRIADLTTLTKVGRLVNSVLRIDEVVTAILEAAFELTGARNGSLLLREGDDLRVRATEGPEAAPVGASVQIGRGIAGEVAESGQPHLVGGDLGPSRRARRSSARPAGSAAVVPLLSESEVRGVLALERPPEADSFTDLDLRSLALFGEHAGTAIANAQRYEEERDAAERLADVVELRSEFVATLVHDLKSPLTAILGYMTIIRKQWEELDQAQRDQALSSVESQASRLLDMVEEILRSASVEAGAELRHERVEVEPLVAGLVDSVRAAAEGREGVSRSIELHRDDGPHVIEGDAEALRHVFANLLENAVKYSPPGSPIEVGITRDVDEVHVAVTDRGSGIPADDLPHLFERFRQVSGKPRSGVGLGLYIVRTLVTAHGGRVEVESEVGSGATFTVALPVHGATDRASDEGARERALRLTSS